MGFTITKSIYLLNSTNMEMTRLCFVLFASIAANK